MQLVIGDVYRFSLTTESLGLCMCQTFHVPFMFKGVKTKFYTEQEMYLFTYFYSQKKYIFMYMLVWLYTMLFLYFIIHKPSLSI